MRIKEVLELPTNELAMILEGLVTDYYALKIGIVSAVDKDRMKMSTINRKIIKVTLELKHRGWEAIEYEGRVNYKLLNDSNKQEELI